MPDQTRQVADHSQQPPGLLDAAIFRGKVTLLQLKRAIQDGLSRETDRYPRMNELADQSIIGESITPLWTAAEPSEQYLLAGKAHNLRIMLQRLNGVEVPANRTFSFWKQLGRVTRRRGFVAGRELREGCIIPNIGGGLCQLSNALYDAALSAGFEIVERHAHSRVIAGSLAEVDRDATIFWNYVDLRFRSPERFRIEALLTGDSLIVRFRGAPRVRLHRIGRLQPVRQSHGGSDAVEVHSCVSCNTVDCFRHVPSQLRETSFGRVAFLVDEYWREFDRYLNSVKRESDLLCLPLDGRRYGRANYAWVTDSFRQVNQQRLFTLYRSRRSRSVAHQGAARQRAFLANNERLAGLYSKSLTYDVTHVTLMQQLLPYLWRDGHLGGRTFDVLMTSLPLQTLHDRLDAAAALHPESMTLADFRADRQLVEAEAEALRHARRIITPHTEIARLFRDQAVLIDWEIPTLDRHSLDSMNHQPAFLFPAPTVGRKGAYELREALQGLSVSLAITGPMLETQDFWHGLNVHVGRLPDWLGRAAAVVLPAFIEHQPRRLLEAVARGVPVIASTACGLENVAGVISVQPGDVSSLRNALRGLLPAA
jgi:hypothetical protein